MSCLFFDECWCFFPFFCFYCECSFVTAFSVMTFYFFIFCCCCCWCCFLFSSLNLRSLKKRLSSIAQVNMMPKKTRLNRRQICESQKKQTKKNTNRFTWAVIHSLWMPSFASNWFIRGTKLFLIADSIAANSNTCLNWGSNVYIPNGEYFRCVCAVCRKNCTNKMLPIAVNYNPNIRRVERIVNWNWNKG